MTITAIYENGVFRPLQPVNIPDKSKVQFDGFAVLDSPVTDGERPLMRLVELLDQFPDEPTTPPDYSYQLDHYLYGTPKKP